ncbi:MAG: hypothetical protein L0Y44_12270 [Phycisphaerales bacterium]|nr:hypothetical protein [Phycisphaerales bacterium]MCI0631416.1 hypothetical protein [Phycisphaerales bacterium]
MFTRSTIVLTTGSLLAVGGLPLAVCAEEQPQLGFEKAPIKAATKVPEADGGIAGLVFPICGDASLIQSLPPFGIVAFNSIACVSPEGVTGEQAFAREWDVPFAGYTVKCVDFGVEVNTGDDYIVTVNIWEGDGFIGGDDPDVAYTLLGSLDVLIPADPADPFGPDLDFYTADFAAAGGPVFVPGAAASMVVEIFCPSRLAADGGDDSGGFWIGSNFGQTAPGWARTSSCGVPTFTNLALYQPSMCLLMCVDIDEHPCPSDVAPPGGNGLVNIEDLLEVITHWGPCVGCPADIQPPGGDGVVNVGDLLAVIGEWGPCQ